MISLSSSDKSTLILEGCTLTGYYTNYAVNIATGVATITNTILWNDSVPGGEIALRGNSILNISYSDVAGGEAGVYVEEGCIFDWGEGNIDADPLFVDAAGGDYHLLSESSCIDAGDPAGDYTGQVDMDGEPRVMNGRVDIGADEYCRTQRARGIDVSSWQGNIDWSQVYNAGYRFAFVRASWWYNGIDGRFETNMENADAAAMLVGAYHFAYPEYADAGSEARHFFNVAKDYLKEGYLGPALDIENDPCSDSYPYELGPEGLSNWVHKWMNTVKALARLKLGTAVEPILYVNSDYANNYLNSSVTKYDLWIAHWRCDIGTPPNTGIWGSWDFWQYWGPEECGDNSVPGITGSVDLDLFNGDMSRLNTFKISVWEPDFWILAHLCSPADMVLTNPDGLIISKGLNQIPGAAYVEIDIDQDGDLDKEISIPYKKVGYYQITIVPEPNALPDDTYSLEATVDGQTMVLAEDVQIQDIPPEPYEFESRLNRCDFDTDGDVDTIDLDTFVQHWLAEDCNYPSWCEGTDLDYSGRVNFVDFAIFTENWLWKKIPADVDIDGDIDFTDYALLASCWRYVDCNEPTWCFGADINKSGYVDLFDLAELAEHWLAGR